MSSKTKKTVLLTGASRGIGKAIQEILLNSGLYTILAPSRNEMDLNSPNSMGNYLKKTSPIDILINNAAINVIKSVEQIDEASLDDMMRVNLKAPLKTIQHVVPSMKKNRFGRIVNISSIWGVHSKEFRTLYSMTKFGLNGMTKALAKELGAYNILVNAVCPGFVNTEMTKKNLSSEEQNLLKKFIPLGRFAEPEEIAQLVKFLISEENTYITGQIIIMDGGFLA